MQRIHTVTFVPKYCNGKWVWNKNLERIEFEDTKDAELVKEDYVNTCGFNFSKTVNQLEELIFRQEFQRSDLTHDADVILVQDIKNVVLFLAPSEIITKDFIYFLHTFTVDRFLRALIIYFEYYLKMVEFVLIRRDEITGDKAQIQSEDTNEIKRIYSEYLTQHRLLLAREYSTIIMGEGEMKRFYHITPIVNISQSIKDKRFYETFLAFSTQVVWIAMHRRAYDYIDLEMYRLFRSEHFKLKRYAHINFTQAEANMLYGKNYKRRNYRTQNSPLIQELANVATENLPILWIGERKYRGTDLRVHQMELEYIVPDSQLILIDTCHGILGHPKKIYDTILNMNWEAVRFQNYSETYDPYQIKRQPALKVPSIDAEKMRKYAQEFDTYYHVRMQYERVSKAVIDKWCRRDEVIEYFSAEDMITNIVTKCERELQRDSYGPSVQEITDKFLERKKLLRKQ
ncbi:protein phosphatase 1 regulatory subunit 36-like [Rhagoletis pomonella]|uniref:protein phosphatase 1 regulatory subunit 36-like n=1 Tax=Rhagoletis pomonella TaxID=28610 RepID=UPI00177E6876|nr:protein phosphatase 1 regulatory subunit 36-like [Rhagoletis pomonella]